MSSTEPTNWARVLRNKKEYSPIVIGHVDILPLLSSATARAIDSEGKEVRGGVDVIDASDASGPPPLDPEPKDAGKKRKIQSHTNEKRARKRTKQSDRVKHAAEEPRKFNEPVETTFEAWDLPSKADGYAARPMELDKPKMKGAKCTYRLEDLAKEGIRVIPWNGRVHKPILDRNGRVIAVLVGLPDDSTFDDDCHSFHKAILQKRSKFSQADSRQDRGNFPAERQGISYGMGQAIPMCITHTKYGHLMEELLGMREAARISGYQSAAFARWSPENYQLYQETKTFIQEHEDTYQLRWNFNGSVFACATVNFGPQTCTFKHRDVQNLPHGWCAVTAMGSFDYRKGGHLVLWDLGVALEFPPGSTILLPSATLLHSNIPVGPNETRTSYTQYSAGPLFRWVKYGGRNLGQLEEQDKAAYEKHVAGLKAKAGLAGIERFSTLDDLLAKGHVI
ncbi:hypothetical protein V5O48_009902 [Marasmius crinis-equi]|uniref:Uncharacterized protein n=1 Tax=Marasmius crinis-equi TaxID=585013 RepID=A0ABR3F9S4_9AGAR